jgi:hypothetical protein
MCVTFAPARLSGTIVYIGKQKSTHVVGYQTTAISKGPNAIILHVPGQIANDNLIDTRGFPNLFKNMRDLLIPRPRNSFSFNSDEASSKTVDHHVCGLYDILVTDTPTAIPGALAQIPVEKRPNISAELMDYYSKPFFKGNKFLVWCFDEIDEANLKQPILFSYTPTDPDVLTIPGIDAHDGGVPKLGLVDRDHWLLYGSYELDSSTHGTRVRYSDKIPSEIKQILPNKVIGKNFSAQTQNGDFTITAREISQGISDPRILMPV